MDIAEDHNLFVIEDAAEAHGAEYKGKKVGTFGDISCFSFYGNKLMTTGEGGICLSDSEDLIEKMEILRDHGMNTHTRYWYDFIGFNYRMTNLQAAVGVAQLNKLDSFLDKKRSLAAYAKNLKPLKEEGKLILQPEMQWTKSSFWIYFTIIKSSTSRDELMELLKTNNIDIGHFFIQLILCLHIKQKRSF